ncbi:MAG: hypothetical protein A4E48_01364 [Methanosaeta sp. PtaU1.Bin060]|jgi:hypothetical protein|nr:MAG: hypothetical protein A4E48_01364 [Methanosaeta sp. PtaU1.Bin060]
MILLSKDEKKILEDWAEVLKRRNCIEIYEYLDNVILQEGDYVGDFLLDKAFILKLLKMAKESDLPCEVGPYGNLKQDIDHYINVISEGSNRRLRKEDLKKKAGCD